MPGPGAAWLLTPSAAACYQTCLAVPGYGMSSPASSDRPSVLPGGASGQAQAGS